MKRFVNRSIRWGILGCGSIARQFARALSRCGDAEIWAVGSRFAEKANAFASEFACPRAYGSYELLAKDPELDVVYVATPHPWHADHTLLCLGHGKHVLCEKPFTLNAEQARRVVAEARRRKLFLMEAMWTRFFPAMGLVRRLLAEGAIGKLRMFTADFGFAAKYDPASRLFDPNLGGGALLDVGVYGVSLCSLVLGEPAEVHAVAEFAPTGVDTQSAYLLRYGHGPIALLSSAITTQTPWEATILGDQGSLRIHSPFWKPYRFTIERYGEGKKDFESAYEGDGYEFEIEEVCRCLRAGRTESEGMPLDESVRVMSMMDAIRRSMGLRYPHER